MLGKGRGEWDGMGRGELDRMGRGELDGMGRGEWNAELQYDRWSQGYGVRVS